MLQICQKPEGIYAIGIVEQGWRLCLAKTREILARNALEVLFSF